jgi:antitoxin ParD1/3/4
MTMNVNLSPQLEAKVASGRYTSASEVVREALRLMEHQDQLRDLQLQELRRAIQDGLHNGEPVAWNPEAIKAAGSQRLRAQVDSKPGV